MTKKKAIIHIGSPKTGTTAIQTFCALNAEHLAQLGIIYPAELMRDPGRIGGQAHHCLVNLLMDSTSFWQSINLRPKNMNDADIVACLKNLSRKQNILLSTENLVWLDQSAITQLKDYLVGFDVHVILYARRQDDALQALYQTVVALIGETRHFKEYADSVALELFEYDRIAETWQSVVGAGNLVVRVYEKEQLHQADIVLDFIQTLAGLLQIPIDISNWEKIDGTVNRGLPAYVTHFIRYQNNYATKKWVVPAIRVLFRLLHKNSRGSYDLIRPSERKALLERFAKSNENLARKFLNRGDGVLFRNLDIKQTDKEWNDKYNGIINQLKLFATDIVQQLRFQKIS